MTQEKHDFLVFIGRFQPFHNGHAQVVTRALSTAHNLIILIGSAHRPSCTRNPWSFKEREQMIRSILTASQNDRVHIAPLVDATYNDDVWLANVQRCVNQLIIAHHTNADRDATVGLIGLSKDRTSYYLRLFPTWSSIEVDNSLPMTASDIREAMFCSRDGQWENYRTSVNAIAGELVPDEVLCYLNTYIDSDAFKKLRDEFDFIKKYRARWDDAPYPPMFLTVDAIVIQSGHILLVERRSIPGKGQHALPGGFLDSLETLRDSMLRELKEETNIKIPLPVLAGSIVAQRAFDDPYRSARGRTVTHAFYIHLKPDDSLPKVKGGDDAARAFWLPLAELNPKQMFEDHYCIIQHMIGRTT